MSGKKKIILVLLFGGYLFCVYAGISGAFSFLNLYSQGSYNGDGAGYLWELVGMFCWMAVVLVLPDKYYLKNSKWFTAFLIGPILLLSAISLLKI